MRHPTVDWLATEENITLAGSFDVLYDHADSFDQVYEEIVQALIAAAGQCEQVGFLVPGHPRFGERSVDLLQIQAPEAGITVDLVESQSYLDAVLSAEQGPTTPLRVLDALEIIAPTPKFSPEPEPLDPGALHVIYQVYDRVIASDLKLALLEIYPPEARVVVVTAAGVPGAHNRFERSLADLDHAGIEFHHLTTVLVPPLANPELFTGFGGLLDIMARLRNPVGGCPWDVEQSPTTLRRFLLEETYEVLDAMDSGDPTAYSEELGDLLLQVVFHAQIARESGEFTMRDVIRAIVTKLVRRHPHVFGDTVASSADEVLVNWAAIKKSEKGYEDRKSILDGVPRAMPALMRAQEISRRAAKAGFEWDSIEGVFAKLDEEVAELREAIAANAGDQVESELGDLLFTVVNLARFRKVEAEDALGRMVERFMTRFRRIEDYATADGRAIHDLSQVEMERVWEVAKGE